MLVRHDIDSPRLGQKDLRGSRLRCLMLTSLSRESVAQALTSLVKPFAVVSQKDFWMPGGFFKPDEAKLGETPDFLCAEHRELVMAWWLKVRNRYTNTPNWDIASTCTIGNKQGLILVEAKAQGLVGHIGVTGHGWTIAVMHARSLEAFDFDSILLPYNYVTHRHERYRAEFDAVVATCEARNVAVQTIKSLARGPWATTDRSRSTWYQPLEEQSDIDRAVHWVLGRPGVFLNTAGDINLLPKILDAASRFEQRPSDDEMRALTKQRRLSSIFGI